MAKTNQSKRQPLSKKIRFEVFKRDKFTCAYCGRKAPDVILEVDHIIPVAKGGDNNITNLITSCIDCNRGKRDIPLQVNETLEKQRLQMELLQDKREQLEMLFEWKKSLDELDEYESDLFINYIEDKIEPYTLTKQFRTKILQLFKKYKHEEIFDAITISANKYLKYDCDNKLIQESANEFLNKIGGILVNKNLPPIKQKLAYIKGICRNRFHYFNEQQGSIILNKYVEALKQQGWSETRILDDIEQEVTRISKESKNWTEWRDILESWISQIHAWNKDEIKDEPSNEELQAMVKNSFDELCFYFEFIIYVARIYGENDKNRILKTAIESIIRYNELQYEKLCKNENLQALKPNYYVFKEIGLLNFIQNIDTKLKYVFSNVVDIYTEKVFNEELYYPNRNFNGIESFVIFQQGLEEKLCDMFNDMQ
ncbi:TPA: hypothetical protein CPT88_08680 [Candidatus Gastranaerophilales bacterium HUM_8]|nr:MAG TPA: hypothetical protein CPT88_08680 [Candidatus Gastranaerophilales bacterium HUM_8]DAA99025.1 MAG TPA: hypothetical protein CPT89_11105 [Candidatus Gastranaerophilales bacterium HUM_11]